jgi:hypothetical protein
MFLSNFMNNETSRPSNAAQDVPTRWTSSKIELIKLRRLHQISRSIVYGLRTPKAWLPINESYPRGTKPDWHLSSPLHAGCICSESQ